MNAAVVFVLLLLSFVYMRAIAAILFAAVIVLICVGLVQVLDSAGFVDPLPRVLATGSVVTGSGTSAGTPAPSAA